jgi:hypothetical protein
MGTVSIFIALTETYVPQQQKGNYWCISLAVLPEFMLFTATCCSTTERENTVAFTWQQSECSKIPIL